MRKKKTDIMVPFSFTIPKSYLDHLKSLCWKMSYTEKKQYSISFFIRETLYQAYPPPKDMQSDLFGDKK
jgi:hypothetical protein